MSRDFLALSGPYKGKHYMMVNAQGPMGLFYNQDTFDKAGLAYPKDWKWDDLLAAAKRLTIRQGPRIQQFGVQVGRFAMFVYQNGGAYLSEDRRKCLLDKPEAIEAIQWVADLQYKYHVAPLATDTQTQPTTFQNGRIAMFVGEGPWMNKVFREGKFRWDTARVPFNRRRANINYGSGMAISIDSKHPDQAWRWIKFWLREDVQLLFTKTWESMPVLLSAAEKFYLGDLRPETPKSIRVFYDELEHTIVEPYIPNFFSYFWSQLPQELQPVWTGEKTAEQVLKQWVPRIDKELAKLDF